jgi:hypothetical protein
MAEIINLRRARKARRRAEESATAEANRSEHGVAKTERNRAEAESQKLSHDLDSAKLDQT